MTEARVEEITDPDNLRMYVDLNQWPRHDLIEECIALHEEIDKALDRFVKILGVDGAGRTLYSLSIFAQREMQESSQRATLLTEIQRVVAGAPYAETQGQPVDFREAVRQALELAKRAPAERLRPN